MAVLVAGLVAGLVVWHATPVLAWTHDTGDFRETSGSWYTCSGGQDGLATAANVNDSRFARWYPGWDFRGRFRMDMQVPCSNEGDRGKNVKHHVRRVDGSDYQVVTFTQCGRLGWYNLFGDTNWNGDGDRFSRVYFYAYTDTEYPNCQSGYNAVSAGKGRIYGEKWDYINDWVCLGGYSGTISDNATGWTESDIYLYPAVHRGNGDVFLYGGKAPGRVQTGDCNCTNKLDWKGNAASYGNCDNCYSFGFAWMYSPGGAGPKFLIGADDDQRTYVNGTLISSGSSCCNRDNFETGGIGMPAGWSRILFKVRNGVGGFDGTVSLRNGGDRGWNEGSVNRYSSSYGLGYEQDDWYPRVDVASFYGNSNPQPDGNFYGNNTTVTASGTSSVTGPVPLWKTMQYQWGYGTGGDTNFADVSGNPGSTSWSHTQTGVTGHRRFHFFSVSKSKRCSFQNSGSSGGWNFADGGPANYMDVYIDNLPPNNPSFSNVSAASTTQINLSWTLPLDQGVGIEAGASEAADEAGSGSTNYYRRGNVGVHVRRDGSGVYGWDTGTSLQNTGLAVNTAYTYDIAARDNTGQARGAWNNTTSYRSSTTKYTLQNTPTTPTLSNITQTGMTVTTTGPVNLAAGSSGVIFNRNGADLTKVSTLSIDDTSLSPNTLYTYKAKGVNGDDIKTAYSDTAARYTLIQDPTSLTLTTPSHTQIYATLESTFTGLDRASSGRLITNHTAATSSEWSVSSGTRSWSSENLTPNTTYSFSGKVRNGDAVESITVNASKCTLAAPPTVGGNVACDQPVSTWLPVGTTFTFSNPAGFGAGTHGGNQYRVTKFKYVWTKSTSYTWTGGEDDWDTAIGESMILSPSLGDGSYYLYLQSWNTENVATPTTLRYGPFQYDGTPPTVSISIPSRNATNASQAVTYLLTFSEAVSGLTTSGITLNQTGTANANMSVVVRPAEPPAEPDYRFWTVTLSNCTGEGSLGIKVNENAAVDRAGNGNQESSNSTTFLVDNTRPACAITRNSPAQSPTNANAVRFQIAFSEPVSGFTKDDISLTLETGITTGTLAEPTGGPTTYYVWVNSISGTGFVSINVPANIAQDAATNLNLAANPVENYFVDQGAFTCAITRTGDNPTNANTVGYRLEFNKEPAAFIQGHITLGGSITGTSLDNFAVDPENPKVYTANVTNISGTGTVSIAIAANAVYDYPGNGITAVAPVAYDIDQGAITGTIARTSASPTNAETVGYQITLNKQPVDFDADSLQLGGTVGGTALDNFTYVGEVEGEYLFTVDVIDIHGTGTVTLALPEGRIHDVANNTNNEIPAVSYTIDQTPPIINAISRYNPSGQYTNAAQVIWRVTFSEQVTGVDVSDFTLIDANNSILGEQILSVSSATGTTIDVTVNTGSSGNGDLRLDVVMPGATITDVRGNPMAIGFVTGEVYTLDRAAPIVESINRLDPAGQYTNASEVTWRVTFSKEVQGIETTDFTLAKTGTLAGMAVTQVSAASGTVIDVTASTGTGNGNLRLDVIVPPASIADSVGNTLTASFNTGQVYALDRSNLTCEITRTSPNPNNAVSVGYQVVFSKSVNDFTLGDVTLGGTVPNTLLSSFSGSGTTYTFNVTNIQTSGTVSVQLAAGVAHDTFGNPNVVSGPVAYTIDKEALYCSIFKLSPNPTNANTVRFQVNFNKSVSDFAIEDITLEGIAGTSLDNFTGSGNSYTVDVVNITGDGQVSITLAPGAAHDAAGNPNSGCGPESYTIDHTGPTCSITRTSSNPNGGSTVGYRIVFSESVNDFAIGDMTLGGSIENTQLADFAGSGTTYTVNVVNIVGNGTVSLAVPAGVAHDSLGNPNTHSGDPVEYTIDQEELTVTVEQKIGQDDPTPWLPILFDVVFSKPAIGFAVGDVVFTGTASGINYSIQGSGATYTIQVNGVSVPGTVQPTLPAGVARDAAYNWNTASTSDDNTVAYQPAPTPSVIAWRSVRTHGSRGNLPIALNPSAVVTESRRYGLQRLEVDFDQAVQPADGSLDLTDVSILDAQSNAYQPTTLQLTENGQRLVVQFSPGLLPDMKRYTINLADNFKGTQPPYPVVGGTRACQIRLLCGDTNNDNKVDILDLMAIKNANRDPADAANCSVDISADGEINVIDLAITNNYYGRTVP